MGAKELNDLWTIVRANERSIEVLKARFGDANEELRKLHADNEAMKAILNRAIGAKTFAGIVGAVIGALVAWSIAIIELKFK